MTIPPHLIFDPYAPVPATMGKINRRRLQELRVAYQESIQAQDATYPLKSAEMVYAYIKPHLEHLKVEQVMLIPVNTRNIPIEGPILISRGDMDGADCGARLILRAALVAGAYAFFLAHNHPTGDPEPSALDISVTRNIMKAADVVGCALIDHIIVGRGRFMSIRTRL